jgi:hypothetical protein
LIARWSFAAHDQPELLWQAQIVVGVTYRHLRRPDEARRALGDAIRSIDQLSTQVVRDDILRQRPLENKLAPYHELIALRIEAGSPGKALELGQRSKARVLTRLLRGSSIVRRRRPRLTAVVQGRPRSVLMSWMTGSRHSALPAKFLETPALRLARHSPRQRSSKWGRS